MTFTAATRPNSWVSIIYVHQNAFAAPCRTG